MTQDTNQTQAAERFIELLAELNDNPITGQFAPLADVAMEAAKDLIESDLKRDVYSDAIRFNKARLAKVLASEVGTTNDPHTQAAAPQDEPAEPDYYKQPDDEGRADLLDGCGPGLLSLSQITYHRLELWEIATLEQTIGQIIRDGGTEEEHAVELAELFTVLSGARTPGELMSMVRHMWYRLAVELSKMRPGLLQSFTETYPPLLKVKPAKARRPQAEATADSKAEHDDDQTDSQTSEIVEAVAHLMSLPLPDKMRDAFEDALQNCDNDTNAGNTVRHVDLIRVWLPKYIREQSARSKKGN
jgi:hypothetical protein